MTYKIKRNFFKLFIAVFAFIVIILWNIWGSSMTAQAEVVDETESEPVALAETAETYYWWVDGGKLTISSNTNSVYDSITDTAKKGEFSSTAQWSEYNSGPWFAYKKDITSVSVMDKVEPKYTDYWFSSMTNLESMEMSGLYATNIESMNKMFYECKKLTSVSFSSNFSPTNVYNMNNMFSGCSELTSVSFEGNFDISTLESEIDMGNMFSNCSKLTSVTFNAGFSSTTPIIMSYIFSGCSSLTTLNLSNFSVKLKDVVAMFTGCSSLTSVTFGDSFDASSIMYMSSMFTGCSSLTTLDLRSIDTSSVKNMNEMFTGCSSLTTLDLRSFNTSNVMSMNYMFSGCTNLGKDNSTDHSFGKSENAAIKIGENFNTSLVTNMSDMFSDCSSLTSIDLSGFNTEMVTEMGHMFGGCSSLTSLDLSSFTINYAFTSMMLFDCESLEIIKTPKAIKGTIDLPGTTTCRWKKNNGDVVERIITSSEAGDILTKDHIYEYNDNTDGTHTKTCSVCGTLITESHTYDSNTQQCACGAKPPIYWWIEETTLHISDTSSTDVTAESFSPNKTYLDSTDVEWDSIRGSIQTVIVEGNIAPTDTSFWFYGMSSLENVDLSGLNTANVTNMDSMFGGCEGLTSLDLSSFNTASVRNMSSMFYYCTGLTSLNLFSFNTANVTNMDSMFYYCTGLTSLNLSQFDTAKVENMNNMFSYCTDLTSLDLSNFNTANVTLMDYMFSSCTGLTSLDLSNFNTANVTNMDSMFGGCEGLTSLDLSNFNTANVTLMDYMFSYCTGLTSLDLSSFNTAIVTNMSYMFSYCTGLTSLDLSSFNTASVNYMNSMFEGCRGLTSLNLSQFDTAKVEDMNSMFEGCRGLTSLNLSQFDTAKVEDMNSMFKGCTGLTSLDLSSFNTASVIDMSSMFNGCSGLIGTFGKEEGAAIKLSDKFTTANVTNMSNMFSYCRGLTSLDLSSFEMVNYILIYNMFSDCISLDTIKTPKTIQEGVSIDLPEAKCCWKKLSGEKVNTLDNNAINTTLEKNEHTSNGYYTDNGDGTHETRCSNCGNDFSENHTYDSNTQLCVCGAVKPIYWWIEGTILYISDTGSSSTDVTAESFSPNKTYLGSTDVEWDSSRSNIKAVKVKGSVAPKDTSYWFSDMPMESVDLSGLDGTNIENMGYMFSGCTKLTSVMFSDEFVSSQPIDMSSMFESCSSLTTLDLSNFSVQLNDTNKMFYNCSNLTSVRFGNNFDTSAVTDMSFMFNSCEKLTSIAFGGKFSTGSVKNMSYMFSGCSSLATLNLKSFNTEKVEDMSYMFSGCSGLIGTFGKEEGAVIKISDKFTTAKVTNMRSMFSGCKGLTSLDLSSFNTEKVEKMGFMFSVCAGLTTLDLSSFDTSSVTDMSGMFNSCEKLTSITFGNNFLTSSVTNMSNMFGECSSLTSLDLSSFNLGNLDATELVWPCTALKTIITPNTITTGSYIMLPPANCYWAKNGKALTKNESGIYLITNNDVSTVDGSEKLILTRVDEHTTPDKWSSHDEAKHYKDCIVCGTHLSSDHKYDQQITTESYIQSPATCTAKAVYYYSCVCGKKGTETFENGDYAAHVYNQQVVDAKYLKSEANCTEEAVYYMSCVCGKMGEDTFKYGKALDHSWGTPTYTWSEDNSTCTAKRICANDSTHIDTETVAASTPVTISPTCIEEGFDTITATFTKDAFTVQTKQVNKKEALDHNWGTPTYTWSEDNSTCTAKRICANDSTHIDTETVAASTPVTISPTCTAGGYDTITATFTKDAFTVQTKQVNKKEALDHNWGTPIYTWSEDNSTCTAKRVCANDSTHIDTETVAASAPVTTAPTCTVGGYDTITATFTNSSFTVQTKQINLVNANGHTEETISAVAATCTTTGLTEGKKCSVCNAVLKEQTEVAALGHDFSEFTIDKESTCIEKGSKSKHCSRCDEKTEVTEIDFAAHTLTHIERMEPTIEAEGNIEYWICTVCQKKFSDNGGVNEIDDVVIPKLVAELVKPDEKGEENEVVVTTPNGFAPDTELVVTVKEKENNEVYENIAKTVNGEVDTVYNVSLKSDGVNVQPDGTVTLKMRIPENLVGENFHIFQLSEEKSTELKYTVEGKFAVVTTDSLFDFIFVVERKSFNPLWLTLIIIVSLVIVGEGGFITYRKVRKNKEWEGQK